MPIADMTGASRNMIDAQQMMMNLNLRKKQTMMGGVAGVADAASEAIDRKTLGDALAKEGLDPALVADPHAAVTAILQKKRDALQREQQLADVQSQRTWQETQTKGQNAQQIMLHGLETPEQKYRRERADAESKALKESSQPEVPPFAGLAALVPGYPKAQPVAPGEGLVRQRMRERGFDYKTQPTENIDPLSPAGVKAQQDVIGVRPAPQGRETPEEAAKRVAAETAARLAEEKKAGAGAFKPTADKPNWMDVKDYGGLIDLRNQLLSDWSNAPTETLKAPIEKKLEAVYEQLAAARKAGGGDRTIGAGGSPAPAGGGIDPTLKAEFDGFPPERQKALLEQMTPEERAKVGR